MKMWKAGALQKNHASVTSVNLISCRFAQVVIAAMKSLRTTSCEIPAEQTPSYDPDRALEVNDVHDREKKTIVMITLVCPQL